MEKETTQERFDKRYVSLSDAIKIKGYMGTREDILDFIQSEIDLAVAKERERILSLAYSATLADHMGDMWDDINKVLKDIGEDELADADHEYGEEDEDGDCESEFTSILKKRGIKTVWGS